MISGNRTLISDSGVENIDTIKAIKLLRTENMLRNYLKEVSTLSRDLGPGKIGMCRNRVWRDITSGTVNNSMETRGSPSCIRENTFIRKKVLTRVRLIIVSRKKLSVDPGDQLRVETRLYLR